MIDIVNKLQMVLITFVAGLLIFVLQQTYLVWTNWEEIQGFVSQYQGNEFIHDRLVEQKDLTLYDPNDNIEEARFKWRCEELLDNRVGVVTEPLGWYQGNQAGIRQHRQGIWKIYNSKLECQHNLFGYYQDVVIYADPCPNNPVLCKMMSKFKTESS